MSGAVLQQQPHNLRQPLLGFHPQKKQEQRVPEDHSRHVQAERSLSSLAQAWDDRAVLSTSLSWSPTSQAQRASAARRPPGKHRSSMRWVWGSQKGSAGAGRAFGELILGSDNATEHKKRWSSSPIGWCQAGQWKAWLNPGQNKLQWRWKRWSGAPELERPRFHGLIPLPWALVWLPAKARSHHGTEGPCPGGDGVGGRKGFGRLG